MKANNFGFDAQAWEAGGDPANQCADLGTKEPLLRFLSAAEMIDSPAPVSIVEGLVWRGQQTILVGESGAGKTFVATSIAAHVAEGRDWFGRRVRRGAVAYLGFEADDFGARLEAQREAGHDLGNFYIAQAAAPLSPRIGRDGTEACSDGELAAREALRALAERAAEPLALVIVDTFRRAMTGSEDPSDNVSAFLRALTRIMRDAPYAGCLGLHHSGWVAGNASKKRERGSSAWRGNSDAVLYLQRKEEAVGGTAVRLSLTTEKARNAARSAPLSLTLRSVVIGGLDEFGSPRTSCIIEADEHLGQDFEAKREEEQQETQKLDLRTLLAIHGHPTKATSVDGVRKLLSVSKAKAFDAVTRLHAAGLIEPGERGKPYRLTEKGLAALDAGGLE